MKKNWDLDWPLDSGTLGVRIPNYRQNCLFFFPIFFFLLLGANYFFYVYLGGGASICGNFLGQNFVNGWVQEFFFFHGLLCFLINEKNITTIFFGHIYSFLSNGGARGLRTMGCKLRNHEGSRISRLLSMSVIFFPPAQVWAQVGPCHVSYTDSAFFKLAGGL
jgi:hypothetical protein